MSHATRADGLDGTTTLRSNRGWFIALGVLLLVLGVLAALNLVFATVASVFYVGILMVAGGIAQIVHAVCVRTWGRFALWIASGGLYALADLFAFANPLLASSLLTLVLAVSLLVAGVLRIVVALRERPRRAWGWVLATGILSLLTGLVILAGWPVNSLWILGLVLAIDLAFQGWAWVAVGLALGRD